MRTAALYRIGRLLSVLGAVAHAQDGPGRGAWEVRTPESQGLSTEALRAAEELTNQEVAGRVCHLVIKNGVIVSEVYRRGHTVSSRAEGYSTTKSLCASLFGVAVAQGWASTEDRVSSRNPDTRRCNVDASFRNVLTMTGQSQNLQFPQFIYDVDGLACLDSLSDFIEHNNPESLTARAWKDKYFMQTLGMEHTEWGSGPLDPGEEAKLPCGYGIETSCRDLARVGQLWANEGFWPGFGQLMPREFSADAQRWQFPSSGVAYGFTTWLDYGFDPVDPNHAVFAGFGEQCVHVSRELNAVVVSMGEGQGCGLCVPIWRAVSAALVSDQDVAIARNASKRLPDESSKWNQSVLASNCE